MDPGSLTPLNQVFTLLCRVTKLRVKIVLILVEAVPCHFLRYEPRREKTGIRGFRPGLTQLTSLYNTRSRLEAQSFGFKKKSNCKLSL